MGLTLYVGADESNHGSKKSAEIIVATFSLAGEDGEKVRIPMGRNSTSARKYLSEQGKGWIFTLNGKFARESLTFEVPGLIDYWIRNQDYGGDISRIASAFDGMLDNNEKAQFMEEMCVRYNFEGAVDIRHHAKTQYLGKKKMEKFYDSQLVWAADSISSKLLMESRKKIDLKTYEQYVPVDLN